MALTIGGVFAVFSSGSKYVFRASRRLSAINLAQREMENLREHVRSDTWDNFANQLTVLGWSVWQNFPAGTTNLPNAQFRFTVVPDNFGASPTALPAGEQCRAVYMQVQWDEVQ